MRRRGHEDVASKDVYLNGFLTVAAALVLVLQLINPPTKEATATPPGNLSYMIVWPEGSVDVDEWVYGPGEERPVGFSNRSGKNWSLVRDDLGTANDSMPANIEHSYSRAIIAGHYVFNVQCYKCPTGPVPVSVEIGVVHNGTSRVLLRTNVTLEFHGQELTVVQFDLTKDGTIVPGSAHSVFTPLYGDWKQ
jgi:hypothetical protein